MTYILGASPNISSSIESLVAFAVYLPSSISKVLGITEAGVRIDVTGTSDDDVSLLSIYRALVNQYPAFESLLPINDRLRLVGYQLVVNGKGYMDMSMNVPAVSSEIRIRKVFAGG